MSEPDVSFDFDEELFSRRTFNQFWQIFLVPELERREQSGKPIRADKIFAFQLIQGVDHENKVNINNEVAINLIAEVSQPKINVGQRINLENIKYLKGMELPNKYQNSAHATFLRLKGKWVFTFSFVYNKKRRSDHLRAAGQFLSLSKHALETNMWHPFTENMFAAVELMSKAVLIEFPNRRVIEAKTHNLIKSKINQRKKVDAFGAEFAHLLNQLSELRPPARYISKPLNLDGEKARQMYDEAAELYELLNDRTSAMIPGPRTSENTS